MKRFSKIMKHSNRFSISGMIVLGVILCISIFKLYNSLPEISTILTDNSKTLIQKVSSSKNAYINSFSSFDEKFVELHSVVTKAEGKQIITVDNYTYAKDSTGRVHKIFPNGKINIKPKVDNIIKEVKYAESKNIKTIVAILPPNVVEGVTKLPIGVVDYQNMYNDKIMNQLVQNNVYCVDMRKTMTNLGIDMTNVFFETDHHWKIQNAFRGKNIIVNSLNSEYKLGLDAKGFYSDLDNYTVKTYKGIYTGSYTTATGVSFSGKLDDFLTILPKFDTNFRILGYNANNSLKQDNTLKKPCDLTGTFSDVLFDKTFIFKGSAKAYQSYLRGITEKCIFENKKAPNNLKVLILGTSQSRPLAAFLSLCVKSVAHLDQQQGENTESTNQFIAKYKPNVIIFMYTAETFDKTKIFNYDWKCVVK